jgi:hypothetical protein
MDCAEVGGLLVAYQFATTTDEERDAVDTHLIGCQACLRTYLALKRAAERGPLERPSGEARERLRAEVARMFGAPRAPAPPRVVFLQRRIPLYQGLVAAALAAAVTLLALGRAPRVHDRVREGVPQVDTSRPRAESLQIY